MPFTDQNFSLEKKQIKLFCDLLLFFIILNQFGMSPSQVALVDSVWWCSESDIAIWPSSFIGQRLLSRTCNSYRRKGSRYLATNRRDLRVRNTFFMEHFVGFSSTCVSSFELLSTSLKSNAFTKSATNKLRTWKMQARNTVSFDRFDNSVL